MSDPGGFRLLVRRIRRLRDALLPDLHPTGTYSDAEYDLVASFVLLCHAEVEWYLEQRCLEVVSAAVSAWLLDSKPRSTVIALAAFAPDSGPKWLPSPGQSGPPQIRAVISAAKRSYSQMVDKNNGVNETNLVALLLPLGIRESDLASTFLADMNAFGSRRGDQAHRGIGARSPLDPADAVALLTRILLGLRRLDRRLSRLKSELSEAVA